MVSNQRDLAKALGVSPKTANKYVRDPRWKLGKGPWTDAAVAKARDWRRKHFPTSEEEAAASKAPADNARPGASDGDGAGDADDLLPRDPMTRAKLDLLVKRAAKVEIENTIALGGYLRREDVERGRVERIEAVKAELYTVRVLAIQLEGKSLPERERILEDWARGVCLKFAGKG